MLALKASDIAEKAMKDGYNCCEAVLMAADSIWDLKLDNDVMDAAYFFEEGMMSGCSCGALVGMVMAVSVINKRNNNVLGKKFSRLLHDSFKKEFGSTCCRVIQKRRPLWKRIGHAACIKDTGKAAALMVKMLEGMIDEPGKNLHNCPNI